MSVEQSHMGERFPGCPTPEEIDLVERELRKTSDPKQRRAILSQFLGSLDPDIELADYAANGDVFDTAEFKTVV
jgi:hypothetical protein